MRHKKFKHTCWKTSFSPLNNAPQTRLQVSSRISNPYNLERIISARKCPGACPKIGTVTSTRGTHARLSSTRERVEGSLENVQVVYRWELPDSRDGGPDLARARGKCHRIIAFPGPLPVGLHLESEQRCRRCLPRGDDTLPPLWPISHRSVTTQAFSPRFNTLWAIVRACLCVTISRPSGDTSLLAGCWCRDIWTRWEGWMAVAFDSIVPLCAFIILQRFVASVAKQPPSFWCLTPEDAISYLISYPIIAEMMMKKIYIHTSLALLLRGRRASRTFANPCCVLFSHWSGRRGLQDRTSLPWSEERSFPWNTNVLLL